MKRVFLYFGSFNPVHIGHLAIAHYVVVNNLAEELWYVVSPQNPFKENDTLISAHHRVAMLESAIRVLPESDRVKVSQVELSLPVPSYTYNTMEVLKEQYPQYQFSILMGEDNVACINSWHRAEELVKMVSLVVYPRVGTAIDKDSLPMESITILSDVPTFNISSSAIREYITKDIDTTLFTTEVVTRYIKENKLYVNK